MKTTFRARPQIIMLLPILLGAIVCVVFILIARQTGLREVRIYAVGLVFAALVYVGFAIFGRATLLWLAVEIVGVLLFALVAVFGLKLSLWFLSIGWAAHVGWDVLLHTITKVDFVPEWYPGFCIGFDLLLALYIGMNVKRLSNPRAFPK
jgi:hypothetical protein